MPGGKELIWGTHGLRYKGESWGGAWLAEENLGSREAHIIGEGMGAGQKS